MNLPEGKLALREIKALEDEAERRLKDTRRRTREAVDRASAGAIEQIRLKEDELAQQRCRLDRRRLRLEEPETPRLAGDFAPDKTVVAELAREMFNVITGR